MASSCSVVVDPQHILQDAGTPHHVDSGNGRRPHRHHKPSSAPSFDTIRHHHDLAALAFSRAELDQADAFHRLA